VLTFIVTTPPKASRARRTRPGWAGPDVCVSSASAPRRGLSHRAVRTRSLGGARGRLEPSVPFGGLRRPAAINACLGGPVRLAPSSVVLSTSRVSTVAVRVTCVARKVVVVGSVVKKRRKRMAKKKHRKLLKKTRIQRRRQGK